MPEGSIPQGSGSPASPDPAEGFRCPVARCTGYVVHVDQEQPFWSCGKCGAQWREKDRLLADIEAIVARFPYRRKSYRKLGGAFVPQDPALEFENYEEQVAAEPPERRTKQEQTDTDHAG